MRKQHPTNRSEPDAENAQIVGSLSDDIRRILEPEERERTYLTPAQQRARSMYMFGKSLPDIAGELANEPKCGLSALKRLSTKFGWSAVRSRIEDYRRKTESEIVAEQAAKAVAGCAEDIDFSRVINESELYARGRHFYTYTRLLDVCGKVLGRFEQPSAKFGKFDHLVIKNVAQVIDIATKGRLSALAGDVEDSTSEADELDEMTDDELRSYAETGERPKPATGGSPEEGGGETEA